MTAILNHVGEQGFDWRSKALCDPTGADGHFSAIEDYLDEGYDYEEAERLHVVAESEAKALCARCPIKSQCLQAALQNGEEYGVWGGKNPAERLADRPEWLTMQRLHGLPVTPVVQKDQDAMHSNSGVSAKYKVREQRAHACRDKLSLLPEYTTKTRQYGTHSKDDFMLLLDMVIANPTARGEDLAARLGKSRPWFNDLLRSIFIAMGV